MLAGARAGAMIPHPASTRIWLCAGVNTPEIVGISQGDRADARMVGKAVEPPRSWLTTFSISKWTLVARRRSLPPADPAGRPACWKEDIAVRLALGTVWSDFSLIILSIFPEYTAGNPRRDTARDKEEGQQELRH